MSAVRTQVYLTAEQRRRIDEVMDASGESLAEIVRKALDQYLAEQSENAAAALAGTFGVDPEAKAPDRDEWNRG
jgi:ribbon-helix-helix CopG family protein